MLGAALAFCASRACRMAARESPGGDRQEIVAFGVAGIVSKVVPPKRQRLPADSVLDKPEALSVSDELPLHPMSVVSPSSSKHVSAMLPEALCTQVITADTLGSMGVICSPAPEPTEMHSWMDMLGAIFRSGAARRYVLEVD